ncbi:DHA2 family multidrug resistance protein-like MFS transporter [Novosphingobium sp. PhB165]|nr:DHA2 family multidrug resistance protein-like MFS transporter [Novosphingobium sp. PhB165]
MRDDDRAKVPEARQTDIGAPDMADIDTGLEMPRRLWAIVAISFGTALFVLDGTIANVALPTIARDLSVEQGVVVNVVTVYQLVMVMALLPFANLGERLGLRRVYQTGQLIFMAASALAFLAHSLPTLLIVRAGQAFGAGMAMSVSAALIRQIYSKRSLGSGLGINSVIVASSNALAPVLGGLIVAHADWRWVFVAAVPLAALSLLIGRFLPDPVRGSTPFDWRSGLWSAASFALLIGGIELAAHGGMVALGVVIALAGLGSALALAWRERQRANPVFPVDLLAMPSIGLSTLAAIAAFVGSAALVVALPFRLEQGMGYTPQEVGLLVLPFPLTMLVVAPIAGWLSDHASPSIMGLIGMIIAVAGLCFLAFLPDHAGVVAIAWRLVVAALGFSLFFSPNARMIVGNSPRERAAAAGGLLATGRLFGQTLGAALVGITLSLGLGEGPVPMLACAVLAAVAAFASLVRWRLAEKA